MDILIRNVSLDEFIRADWKMDVANGVYTFCGHPIIEIPTHGRLIDADKFEADNPRHMDADVPYVTEVTVKDILDEAPTVIEASE